MIRNVAGIRTIRLLRVHAMTQRDGLNKKQKNKALTVIIAVLIV